MLKALIAALLVATPLLAQGRPDAIVVLADDGALDPSAGRALRSIVTSQLRKHGITVASDRRTEGTHPPDEGLSSLAFELGARRIFAVRIGGRLGQKVPLTVEEIAPDSLTSVYSASLTAQGLDEADVVTTRLVDAVVDRRSVESTAGMRTVTRDEARPFQKKPGERFWYISLPVALFNANSRESPFGLSVGYGYEAEFFRVSVTGGGFGRGNDGTAYFMLEGAWIPFDGEVSPYLGGGLGYMSASSRGGMGAMVEGGVEAFRLHGVRAMLGVMATIPFYDPAGTSGLGAPRGRSIYPAAFGRLAF